MSQLIKVKEEILKCVADTVNGTALWDTVSHTVDEIRIAYFFILFYYFCYTLEFKRFGSVHFF